jgi:hypothetical protein
MAAKHARRASQRRASLVRMIIFRLVVSAAVLLAALYGGVATGQRIAAYMQHEAERRAARVPVPACGNYVPHDQLAAAPRHHHSDAVMPDCYRPPRPLPAQVDARVGLSPGLAGHRMGNNPE